MNERLFTLLGAGLAVLLLLWLFAEDPLQPSQRVSRPTSRDSGPAGMLGLYRWLEQSGVGVHRLTRRFTTLPEVADGTGNLLVVADPMVWPVRPAEVADLRAWVTSGNDVLLLRNQAHDAAWAMHGSGHSGELLDALGLRTRFLDLEPEEGKALAESVVARRALCSARSVTRGTIAGEQRRLRPVPERPHPALTGVREALVKTPAAARGWYLALDYQVNGRLSYPLLCEPQLQLPVVSAFRLGAGRIWAADYGALFSNDNLDRGDNALLAANLVALSVGPGGRVIFDDMHQGDSELYDPHAFYADPRLHGTLAFLVGMWLVWLLGYSNRFAALPGGAPTATLLDFARAMARFYSRYVRPEEAARGLFRSFFNQVRARRRLPQTGEPAWDALAGIAPERLDELRGLHARVGRGHIDLARLRNLLLDTRNRLP